MISKIVYLYPSPTIDSVGLSQNSKNSALLIQDSVQGDAPWLESEKLFIQHYDSQIEEEF